MSQLVYFVDETSQLGGAELNLLTFAPPLTMHGWKPSVVLPGPGPLVQRLQEQSVPVLFVPRPPLYSTTFQWQNRIDIPNPFALFFSLLSALIWTLRLYRFFQREQPHMVHTVSMWAHACAGLAARLSGITVIWHFQDIVNPRAGWGLYRRLVLLWSRYIPDHILCIADSVAAPFQADRRARSKVSVLWNTIDVKRFERNSDHPNPNGLDLLRIGTVARLTPWKGHRVALRAARALKQSGIPFHWSFAGDGALGSSSYRRELEELIDRWNLAPEVELCGWVEDIPAFYADLDVLVHLPVQPEPFGLVLAEAMAAGLPVISTPGGAEHLVRQGGGVIVPAQQPEPVAALLGEWWHQRHELAVRSQRARTFATQSFGCAGYLDQLTSLYTALLEEANG